MLHPLFQSLTILRIGQKLHGTLNTVVVHTRLMTISLMSYPSLAP
jgi:hypothetical protein